VIITGRAKQRLDLAAQRIGHPVQVRELAVLPAPIRARRPGRVKLLDVHRLFPITPPPRS
jgi:hypothetical protein